MEEIWKEVLVASFEGLLLNLPVGTGEVEETPRFQFQSTKQKCESIAAHSVDTYGPIHFRSISLY
jgi:hypothetical protein